MNPIQINIAEPCHENWKNMSTTEQGRFCGNCQKEVIDFSTMEDPEIFLTLQKAEQKNQSICGRVYHTQLNRPILSTTQKVKNQIAWYWKYITAFFLFSTEAKVFAQKTTQNIENKTTQNCFQIRMGKVAPMQNKKIVTGTVVNEKNEPLPYASIQIKGKKEIVTADSLGKFTILANKFIDTLEISFLNSKTEFVLAGHKSENFVMETLQKNDPIVLPGLDLMPIMGIIMVANPENLSIKKDSIPAPVTTKKTNIRNTLKMYPNPVDQNGTTYIHIDDKEARMISIVNTRGIVLQRNNITNDIKKKIQVQLNGNIIPGFYTLEVINTKGNIINSTSFIVQ